MNAVQKGILVLIKSAVICEALPLPEGFSLDDADPYIKRHHIAALCFDGAVRCGISRQKPIMQQLLQRYAQETQVSERQLSQLRKLFKAFDENGIDYMPLKGCRMKLLYPQPELRKMGDADVLIRTEQYERIIPIMESLGFTSKLESDHELIWQNSGLYLELHKRLIPSYNEDFYAYFGDGWKLAKCREGTRYSMTAEDEFIYLFTHFAKHFRDSGIGCRHVLDLWVFLRANPNLDRGYVLSELEKLELAEFYSNILRLIDAWFQDGELDDKLLCISSYIFKSGSWGSAESNLLSLTIRDGKHMLPGFSGRMQYICKYLFPSVRSLEEHYPVLKKAPWLLPGVWIVRLVRKLLFDRGTLKQHEKNIVALSQDKVDERQQFLQLVGLDYHF